MKDNIILLGVLLFAFTRVNAVNTRDKQQTDTTKIRLSAKVHGGKTALSRDSIYIDLEFKNNTGQVVKLPDIFGKIAENTYVSVTQDAGRVPIPVQVTFVDDKPMPGINYINIGKMASYKFSLNLSTVFNSRHIVLPPGLYRLNFTYMNDKGSGTTGDFDAAPLNITIKAPPKPAKLTGTFTDGRDGQVYKWVKIGSQIWMAQNLNYKTAEHSYYYNNDESNRAKYGMYYDFQVLQEAAPKGWHVPSDAEWQQMELAAGMSNEQATLEGYRRDIGDALLPGGDTGMDVLYAGWHKQGFFAELDQTAYFWTTTQSGAPVYGRMLKKGSNAIYRGRWGIAYAMSIRCVKDDAGYIPQKVNVVPVQQPGTTTHSVVSNVVTFTAKPDILPVKPFKPLTKSKNKTGTFVDERDGQKYSWVKIGKQIWMAQNLNYNTKDGHSHYPDADTTNAKKYGMFYDYSSLKTICPKGWHIPSNLEWRELEKNSGIPEDQLPMTGWHGDDLSDLITGGATGFNALFAGIFKGNKSTYVNERAYFWTTKEEEDDYIFRRIFIKNHNRILAGNQGIAFCLSVRCVKDEDVK